MEDAAQFRREATELRERAKMTETQEIRRVLKELASECELLARQIELSGNPTLH